MPTKAPQFRLALVSALVVFLAACGGESAPESSAPAASQPAASQPTQNAQPQSATGASESAPQPGAPTEPAQSAAPDPAAAAASQDACGNRYIPFLAGAQWQYQVSGDEEKRFTRTIVSVNGNEAAAKDTFELPEDEPEVDDAWQCRNGALVVGGAAIRALTDAGGSTAGANVVSEGVALPADPQPGET